MSDSDEEQYQPYGTPLEPYSEDAFPKKKAFTVEDQVAKDAEGRRRFHGAFTGGFSAGFYNTVGSLEGWKPSEFKSSRSERASARQQNPEDFMDDEDTGEFGIAPKVLRARDEYTTITKRKRNTVSYSTQPIPGAPILAVILEQARDTVGGRLLRRMGWKPGQGVGPRQTRAQKKLLKQKIAPGSVHSSSSSSEEEDESQKPTFAPDDYEPFLCRPKDNAFGMGYEGLDRRSVLSQHVNLFEPSTLRFTERGNKKVAISGQAFGVGALEDDDEDIYVKDDMTKYDFELGVKRLPKQALAVAGPAKLPGALDGFVRADKPFYKKIFPPPALPSNFVAVHGARRTRFEPLPQTHSMYGYDRSKTMGRHDLSSTSRSQILGEEKPPPPSEVAKAPPKLVVRAVPTVVDGKFRPFATDPDKQKRYEDYTEGKEDQGNIAMDQWQRQRELEEFRQAARLFERNTAGLVFDKFVSASVTDEDYGKAQAESKKKEHRHGTAQMQEAAAVKKFGALTREIVNWKPDALVCKRFNVPEPNVLKDDSQKLRKDKKGSIFDYYEASLKNEPAVEGPAPVSEAIAEETPAEPPESQAVEEPPKAEDLPKTDEHSEKPDAEVVEELEEERGETIIATGGIIHMKKPEDRPKSNPQLQLKPLSLPEPTVALPPEEYQSKLDLFKAIFLSDEEEDDDGQEDEQQEAAEAEKAKKEQEAKERKMEDLKKAVVEEKVEPKKRKGILADIKFVRPAERAKEGEKSEEKEKKEEEAKDPLVYGPILPVTPSARAKIAVPKVMYEQQEDWVEKVDEEESRGKDKKKKEKKKKEERSKHKKSKKSHKKKKKKR